MGYQVNKRYTKPDGSIVWRLIFESYTGKKRTQRHVPKKEWSNIGFNDQMTFKEAKALAKQLSAEKWIEFQEKRRNAIQERLQKEEKVKCAWLPDELCERFETEVLKEKICWNETNHHYKQLLVYWRTAKKIIRHLNTEPGEWSDRRIAIYSYFRKNQWSVSYAQKVIRVLNLYGKFYAKNLNRFFEQVPKPSGEASTKIHESFYAKKPQGMTSAPLTWAQLKGAKSQLEVENWNWLYLSLWFGLRPTEIDNLKYKIEKYQGTKVLAVFQHKLVKIPAEQRWKFIPIIFPELEIGLRIIQSGKFRKPSIAVLQKHVNDKATLRAGRKGFVANCWLHGKYPKQITYRWLGHKSIKTTDNHYTQGIQQACEFIEPEKQLKKAS